MLKPPERHPPPPRTARTDPHGRSACPHSEEAANTARNRHGAISPAVPPELQLQHAERDKDAMGRMFAAFPGMQPERAAVLSAAFRGVFLTLLFKAEIGEEIYEEALRVLIRGVALQLLEKK